MSLQLITSRRIQQNEPSDSTHAEVTKMRNNHAPFFKQAKKLPRPLKDVAFFIDGRMPKMLGEIFFLLFH